MRFLTSNRSPQPQPPKHDWGYRVLSGGIVLGGKGGQNVLIVTVSIKLSVKMFLSGGGGGGDTLVSPSQIKMLI